MGALLHLSDPHFGTERPRVVEALLRCVAEQAVSVVVISGDITQRARRGQFRRARVFIDRLRAVVADAPVLVLPGNHDIPLFNLPARLLDPFGGFRRAFGKDLEPSYEDAQIQIQLVNTVSRWRHTDGVVRAPQVARVAQRLALAQVGQLRVVVTHQPAAVVREADAPDLLHGHAAAIRSWSQAGADLLLGGHIHLPYIHLADTHAPQADGPPARGLWVVQAGTALSSRIRHEAGNSFNLIGYGGAGNPNARECVVERWDYIDDDDRFVCRAHTPLGLGTVANQSAPS